MNQVKYSVDQFFCLTFTSVFVSTGQGSTYITLSTQVALNEAGVR